MNVLSNTSPEVTNSTMKTEDISRKATLDDPIKTDKKRECSSSSKKTPSAQAIKGPAEPATSSIGTPSRDGNVITTRLPPGHQLLVLVSSMSGSLMVKANQRKLEAMLQGLGLSPYDKYVKIVDGADPVNKDLRWQLFELSGTTQGAPQYPQLFMATYGANGKVEYKYVGNMDDVSYFHDSDLLGEIVGLEMNEGGAGNEVHQEEPARTEEDPTNEELKNQETITTIGAENKEEEAEAAAEEEPANEKAEEEEEPRTEDDLAKKAHADPAVKIMGHEPAADSTVIVEEEKQQQHQEEEKEQEKGSEEEPDVDVKVEPNEAEVPTYLEPEADQPTPSEEEDPVVQDCDPQLLADPNEEENQRQQQEEDETEQSTASNDLPATTTTATPTASKQQENRVEEEDLPEWKKKLKAMQQAKTKLRTHLDNKSGISKEEEHVPEWKKKLQQMKKKQQQQQADDVGAVVEVARPELQREIVEQVEAQVASASEDTKNDDEPEEEVGKTPRSEAVADIDVVEKETDNDLSSPPATPPPAPTQVDGEEEEQVPTNDQTVDQQPGGNAAAKDGTTIRDQAAPSAGEANGKQEEENSALAKGHEDELEKEEDGSVAGATPRGPIDRVPTITNTSSKARKPAKQVDDDSHGGEDDDDEAEETFLSPEDEALYYPTAKNVPPVPSDAAEQSIKPSEGGDHDVNDEVASIDFTASPGTPNMPSTLSGLDDPVGSTTTATMETGPVQPDNSNAVIKATDKTGAEGDLTTEKILETKLQTIRNAQQAEIKHIKDNAQEQITAIQQQYDKDCQKVDKLHRDIKRYTKKQKQLTKDIHQQEKLGSKLRKVDKLQRKVAKGEKSRDKYAKKVKKEEVKLQNWESDIKAVQEENKKLLAAIEGIAELLQSRGVNWMKLMGPDQENQPQEHNDQGHDTSATTTDEGGNEKMWWKRAASGPKEIILTNYHENSAEGQARQPEWVNPGKRAETTEDEAMKDDSKKKRDKSMKDGSKKKNDKGKKETKKHKKHGKKDKKKDKTKSKDDDDMDTAEPPFRWERIATKPETSTSMPSKLATVVPPLRRPSRFQKMMQRQEASRHVVALMRRESSRRLGLGGSEHAKKSAADGEEEEDVQPIYFVRLNSRAKLFSSPDGVQ